VSLFRDFAKVSLAERNTLLQLFTSPEVQHRYPRWSDEARSALESFRVTYDLWSHDPAFNALVDELTARSPEFARWWKAHGVRPKHSGAKDVASSKAGPRERGVLDLPGERGFRSAPRALCEHGTGVTALPRLSRSTGAPRRQGTPAPSAAGTRW
jgi:hypothetical protein